jgi:hypothetical protein
MKTNKGDKMKTKSYYKKRSHKVTSINLEHWQDDFLKSEKINLSLLARDLIEKYLMENYGPKYIMAKNENKKEEK